MSNRFVCRLPILLALTVVLTGCETFPTNTKKSSASVATETTRPTPQEDLANLRDQMKESATLLNSTLGNLSRLTNTGVTTEAYAAFIQNQAEFTEAANSFLIATGRVRNNSNAYFVEWSAHTTGISDPDIKAVANQRRIFLEQRYNALLPPLVNARAELTTFITDSADVKTALAYDQTADGVAAMSSLISRTLERGETAMDSLKALNEQLTALIALLPPPPLTQP